MHPFRETEGLDEQFNSLIEPQSENRDSEIMSEASYTADKLHNLEQISPESNSSAFNQISELEIGIFPENNSRPLITISIEEYNIMKERIHTLERELVDLKEQKQMIRSMLLN
jgi:hypothetical protein